MRWTRRRWRGAYPDVFIFFIVISSHLVSKQADKIGHRRSAECGHHLPPSRLLSRRCNEGLKEDHRKTCLHPGRWSRNRPVKLGLSVKEIPIRRAYEPRTENLCPSPFLMIVIPNSSSHITQILPSPVDNIIASSNSSSQEKPVRARRSPLSSQRLPPPSAPRRTYSVHHLSSQTFIEGIPFQAVERSLRLSDQSADACWPTREEMEHIS